LKHLGVIDELERCLAPDLPDGKFLIAYSGGVDSHVLLHAMHSLKETYPLISLRAVHVDHGLHANSKNWAKHCQAVCESLGVACETRVVVIPNTSTSEAVDANVGVLRKEGLESYARRLRYAQLSQVLEVGELLLCAHHMEDQAETVLLQSMRGAGVKGLSAMPQRKPWSKSQLVRPLLGVAKKTIMTYAHAQGLRWVEDPSNQSCRFSRNYIRHQVMPVMGEHWPQAAWSLAKVAKNCAVAQELLNEIAHTDWQKCCEGASSRYDFLGLSIQAFIPLNTLRQLTQSRRLNVLRFWLGTLGARMPCRDQLMELDRLVSNPDIETGEVIMVEEAAGRGESGVASESDRLCCCVRLWNNAMFLEWEDSAEAIKCKAHAENPLPRSAKEKVIPWDLSSHLSLPRALRVIRAEPFQHYIDSGCDQSQFEIRFRNGGERIKLPEENFHRQLKTCFQTWKVPPWWRSRIPLLYYKGELIEVIGLNKEHYEVIGNG
jgi:tRNA(Ile)-lysidine synthase